VVDVFANDTAGADGVDLVGGVALVAGSLSGTGSLAYNGDGTFTYTPGAGEEGAVTFRYQITDGDGDTSTATATITLLADSVPTILLAEGSDTSVDEAALSVGSTPASNAELASGALVVTTGSDTIATLVVNGIDVTNGGTVDGVFGVLTVALTAGVYSYSYELTTVSDDGPGAESDSFAITVTDSDGDAASTSLTIDIVDDVPTARNDSALQAIENAPVVVDVFANDTAGADGVDLVGGVALVAGSLSGTGSLAYNGDGTFTYTPGAGEEGAVTFRYQITDGDGDTSTATATITLLADSVPVAIDVTPSLTTMAFRRAIRRAR
jgi:hypothetical protein